MKNKETIKEMIRRIVKEEIKKGVDIIDKETNKSYNTVSIMSAINKIKKTESDWGKLRPKFKTSIGKKLYGLLKNYGVPDSWPDSKWIQLGEFLKNNNIYK